MAPDSSRSEADEISDEELIARYQQTRDMSAYEQLHRRHKSDVLAYCRLRASHEEDGSDAAQETWLKVLAKPESYQSQPGASFRKWLFTLAHNFSISLLLKRKKHSELDDDRDSGEVEHELSVELKEQAQRLSECIEKLPPQQKCIVRATFQGLKTGEAAAHCGCTAEQAASAKTKATVALRECVNRPAHRHVAGPRELA